MALRQSSDKEPSIELFIKVSPFMSILNLSKQSSEEKGHSDKGLLLIYECCQTTVVHNYCHRGSNNQRAALFLIGAVPRYHTLQMLGCLYPRCEPQLVSYQKHSPTYQSTPRRSKKHMETGLKPGQTHPPQLRTHSNTVIYLKVTKVSLFFFLTSFFLLIFFPDLVS